jgi:ketosteroid isomerase-like protein
MMVTGQSIEARLRAVEDHIAVTQLVSAYGYAIDGRNKEVIGDLYAEDGVYTVGDAGTFEGRAAIRSIADMEEHVEIVEAGCAHISTAPHVVIDGDRAAATCHTLVARNGDAGFFIWRLSASRIECARKPDGGWEIARRENQLLADNPRAPMLLARLMDAPSAC